MKFHLVNRRHLNSGQRAMAVAMAYPKADEVGGRGKKSSVTEDISSGRLSMARTVLRDSRAIADEVMSGAKFLDAA